MTEYFRRADNRPLRRMAGLLAMALVLTLFLSCPGRTAEAEVEDDPGESESEWCDIRDLILGEGYTIALRKDGRVLYTGKEFPGIKERIAGWEQIERIELQGFGRYLVGFREDGSIRLELLFDPEEYGSSDHWTEEDLASWSGVTQMILEDGRALGLTEAGTVLTLPRGEEDAELCREISEWTDICQIAEDYSGVMGLRNNGTVVFAAIGDYGRQRKAFWEDETAAKNIRELVKCFYTVCALDENGTLISDGSELGWTNIEKVYYASDSMFGLRGDGTVAVCFGFYPDDPRLLEVAGWDHITALGFDVTGWARYLPVGLRDDGTVCAVMEDDGNRYGSWDFTGWTDVKKLYSGTDFTIGIRSDGSLLVTGGEFGGAPYLDEIAGWTDIRAIYFIAFPREEYPSHIVGLKTDGTLVAAGDNSLGQCDVG